jgi:aryl-alcohol dehydrogenase-like predicted oxidoreductase
MKTRKLGKTDLELPVLSFGASSLGAEFRSIDVNEALKCVPAALDCGMNFIDTSPFYGRGMSEVLLGVALKDIPRDKYVLGTKLGRYDLGHFDFSAKRVQESVDVSLHRMRVEHLDIILCHDIEFVDMRQVVEETIPALRKIQEQGKVRYIGISGYPMKIFNYVLDHCDLDVVLSYNHYHLQSRNFEKLIPRLKERGVGIMNAAPFCARLLTKAPLPAWHKSEPDVRAAAQEAIKVCDEYGVDIAQLAVQFAIINPDITTCITGSANPNRVRQWAEWSEIPINEELLAKVEAIFAPVMGKSHIEGLPENN